MRRILPLTLPVAALILFCSYPEPILAADGSPQSIVIRDESTICVTLRIDQSLWPRPLLPGADYNFSIQLARALDQALEDPHGSHNRNSGPSPRIVVDNRGTNPLCERNADDIHISATYALREDGTPFRFSYRIEQAQASIAGSIDRDIEDEWRSGRLPRIGHGPLEDAIVRDIPARAQQLRALIEIE